MALILENMVVFGTSSSSLGITQELDDDVTGKPAFAGFAVEVVELDT